MLATYRIHKRSLSLCLSPSRAQEKLGMEKEGGRKDDRAAEPRFSGAKVVIKAFSLARARREKEGTLRQRLDRQPHLKEGRGNEMNQAAKEGPHGGTCHVVSDIEGAE